MPVYFYEYAATRPERRNLADIRAGEYEGLRQKLAEPDWAPRCGALPSSTSGSAPRVVGAREFLIAYNVNVNSRDQKLANEVALNIREADCLEARCEEARSSPTRKAGSCACRAASRR